MGTDRARDAGWRVETTDTATPKALEKDYNLARSLVRELRSDGFEVKTSADGLTVVIPQSANFNFDRSNIRADAMTKLTDLARIIKTQAGDKPLEVTGHTDSYGSDAYNDRLSTQRVESASKVLQQNGVANSITKRAMGEHQLLVPGTGDKEQQAANRRVEVKIELSVPQDLLVPHPTPSPVDPTINVTPKVTSTPLIGQGPALTYSAPEPPRQLVAAMSPQAPGPYAGRLRQLAINGAALSVDNYTIAVKASGHYDYNLEITDKGSKSPAFVVKVSDSGFIKSVENKRTGLDWFTSGREENTVIPDVANRFLERYAAPVK